MYSGPPAARRVSDHGGPTVHRRSLTVGTVMVDLHFRIAQFLVGSPAFATAAFLEALGVELGTISPEIYEDFVQSFFDSVRVPMRGGDLVKTPVFFNFYDNEDVGVYRDMGKTRLFALFRFMMGEFFTLGSFWGVFMEFS